MVAIRWEGQSTGASLNAILALIAAPNTKRVLLFVSEKSGQGQHDGSDANLPLMAAVVEHVLPGIDMTVDVVFDGLFLTAARPPRAAEVGALLDAGIQSAKAFFVRSRVPFTSESTPEQAAETLKSFGSPIALTVASRPDYYSLLCSVPEAQARR